MENIHKSEVFRSEYSRGLCYGTERVCQKKKEGGDMFRRGCMRRERRRDDMVPGALKTQN